MIHKIGEIITLSDGRTAEVVEDVGCVLGCKQCCLFSKEIWSCMCGSFNCSPSHRSDHKNIIYKEIIEELKSIEE